MPRERLTMRRIRQVLQLHFGAHAGARVIAREVGVGRTTVQDYLARAGAAGLGWPLAPDLTDEALEHLLFPAPTARRAPAVSRTRLGSAGARDEAARGQPLDFVGGIQRCPSAGVCLQPVLRALPGVRTASVADHAPDPRRRAQGVRRLFRQEGADHRPAHRRSAHGGDLCRRAGCVEPDLRGGDLDTEPAGLDRRACADVPVLGRGAAAAGPG